MCLNWLMSTVLCYIIGDLLIISVDVCSDDGQKSSAATSELLESTYALAAMTNLWRRYTSSRVTQSDIPSSDTSCCCCCCFYDRQINVVIREVSIGLEKFMLSEATSLTSWEELREEREELWTGQDNWPCWSHASIVQHSYQDSLIAETATGQLGWCVISWSRRYAGYECTMKAHQRTRVVRFMQIHCDPRYNWTHAK